VNQYELHTIIAERRGPGGAYTADVRDVYEAYKSSLGVKRDANPARVLVCLGEPGVGFWRVWVPFAELAKDPRLDITITAVVNEADVDAADVIWVQRAASEGIAAHIERAQRLGKRVVFELDDYMREIPLWNPAHHILKTQAPDHVQWTHRQIEMVDTVVTSTEFLASLYRTQAKRVVVLENCVNPELWDCGEWGAPFRAHEGIVTIGWGGSNSHWDDVAMVAPAIKAVIDEHPNVWFVRLGYSGPDFRPNTNGQHIISDPFAGIPRCRHFSIGWESHPHTLTKYESLIDVAVAPLVYSDFNASKSNVKTLQAFMSASAFVATDIECYRMGPPGNPTRLIRNNRLDRWIGALEELVDNRDMRVELGRAGHQYVLDNFDIRKRVGEWADVLLGLGGEARVAQAERTAELQANPQPFRPQQINMAAFAPILQEIGRKGGWSSIQVGAVVDPATGWAMVTIMPTKAA
jgi:glycosyltransferase involved in cell wall biosynthesis